MTNVRANREIAMTKREQIARDRVGNASAALFDVESMLPPDGAERHAVYLLRVRLNELKANLIKKACED